MSGDGGPALKAQINFSNHLVADAAGNLFIADTANHRVRKISTHGIITTVAGTGDGGPAEKAQTSNPDIIAFGPNGNLFIPDHLNAVVRKLTQVEIKNAPNRVHHQSEIRESR
jgi:hypothetical protein